MYFDKDLIDRARWIVEHGADKKPELEREVGIPLYIEIPEPMPAPKREIDYTINM